MSGQPRGWQAVHAAADRHAGKVERLFTRAVAVGRQRVDYGVAMSALQDHASDRLAAALRPAIAAIGDVLRADLPPILLATLRTSGDALARAANRTESFRSAALGISFDRANPAAVAWAKARAGELIQNITAANLDAVRELVRRAIVDGIPPRRLAQLIPKSIGLTQQQVAALLRFEDDLRTKNGRLVKAGSKTIRVPPNGMSEFDIRRLTRDYSQRLFKQRALNIARTETIAASNQGQQELWRQAKLQGRLTGREQREWIVTTDDRLCPICAPMAGQLRGLNEPFTSALGPVMAPPAHPQCRCAMGLSDTGENQRVTNQPSSRYPPANPTAKDTLSRFTRHGELTRERRQLHDAIIREQLRKATPVERPEATVFGGGPASGKSTVAGKIHGKANSLTIDADVLRALLPEYNELLAAGDASAAAVTHEEASLLSKELSKQAVLRNYNVTLDGTGDSSYESLAKKVANFRANGATKVEGLYVTVDTDEAIRRMIARAEQTGRYVPETYVREVHASISEVLPRAMRDGLFDDVVLYDTNGAEPIKVATAHHGEITVYDQDAWQRFLAKAKP